MIFDNTKIDLSISSLKKIYLFILNIEKMNLLVLNLKKIDLFIFKNKKIVKFFIIINKNKCQKKIKIIFNNYLLFFNNIVNLYFKKKI